MDCVILSEHKLHYEKTNTKYNKYMEELKLKNHISILDETENYLLDIVNTSNKGYVSEHGTVERWAGGIDRKKWSKEIKKYSKKTRNKLEKKLNEQKKIK